MSTWLALLWAIDNRLFTLHFDISCSVSSEAFHPFYILLKHPTHYDTTYNSWWCQSSYLNLRQTHEPFKTSKYMYVYWKWHHVKMMILFKLLQAPQRKFSSAWRSKTTEKYVNLRKISVLSSRRWCFMIACIEPFFECEIRKNFNFISTSSCMSQDCCWTFFREQKFVNTQRIFCKPIDQDKTTSLNPSTFQSVLDTKKDGSMLAK